MPDNHVRKQAVYHLWTFTISKMISSFGSQTFAISFYILQLTGSAASFATNLVCNVLPRALAGPLAGYCADTYPRKHVIIGSQLLSLLSILGLLTTSLTVGISLPAIYATTVVLSIASAFNGITFTSSITGLVDESRVQRAMALNQMSISISAIGSPAVGGLLYGSVGIPVFLTIYAAASLVALLLELTMNFDLFSVRSKEGQATHKVKLLKSTKSGLHYARQQPLLMTMIWVALLVNFLIAALTVGYSFILIEKLNIRPKHFGLIEGTMAAGTLLISIYLAVRKPFRSPLQISKWGIVALGVQMNLIALPLLIEMPYAAVFVFYGLLALASGTLTPLINTPLQVYLLNSIDDDYKGRILSILETMALALMPLGMILFGVLYDVLPAPWILISSSSFLIATVLVLLRSSVIQNVEEQVSES